VNLPFADQGLTFAERDDQNSPRKTPHRLIGYARVSTYGTYGQTLDSQFEQLRAAGCSKIYRERVT
jgi:hypothetical protein